MPFATRLVTLSGECFEALFEREESAQPMRIGSYHLFRLTDIREGRGERLVSVFGPKQIKGEIEIARINAIRRAFDSGKLSFDEPYDEYKYNDGVELKDSDFGKQRQVSDSEIRQFLIHKAYWVGHMDSAP